MKIAIIGYSGSGKSTLAEYFGKKYGIAALYLDTVHWLPGWKERDLEEKKAIVNKFLDENSSWVIDGNYSKLLYERRMAEADKIIFMNFNRFNCLYRAYKRYFKYKGKSRVSMTDGCKEKIDLEFVKWILYKGRSKRVKKHYEKLIDIYGDKTVVVKNQKQLDLLYARE